MGNYSTIRLLTLLSLAFIGYTTTTHAQSASDITGQYMCLGNKNFGGYEKRREGTSTAATNFMLYLDFVNSRAEGNVVFIKDLGLQSAATYSSTIEGTFDVTNPLTPYPYPVPNIFLITINAKITSNYIPPNIDINTFIPHSVGTTVSVRFNFSPVNNKTTLIMQPDPNDNDRVPDIAVCNKI